MDFFYEKATSSDATPWWYSEKVGETIPDKEAFFKDFDKHYFQDLKNNKGRCFHIIKGNEKIGQINYNEIIDEEVELDIMIYDKENWSQGYGTSALKLLTAFVEEKYHVKMTWLEVHTENPRARRAYENAGFKFIKEMEENGITWSIMEKKNTHL